MCAMLLGMGGHHERLLLSTVEAAKEPPVPFTANDLVTLRNVIASKVRSNEKQRAKNEARGVVLPGADANAERARRLEGIADKLEAWLEATWPAVQDAREAARDDSILAGLR